MAKLSALLDQIDAGTVLLPEFQRGYVWNRDQVRGLMRSLYLGHPVGGLLLWETAAASISVRGAVAGAGTHLLLLDGQQRITTLYGIIRGKPPVFFEGDDRVFTGLHFNVESETFEFYSPSKMADDPRWVNVTGVFVRGPASFLSAFVMHQERMETYLDRLNTLRQIREKSFNVEEITGRDRRVDEVVDIFNRVNSGGTKLSKGDLALAKLCAEWPEARSAMREGLSQWRDAKFSFTLDWLLRNITAVAAGRSQFSALDKVTAVQFRQALSDSVRHVGTFLDAASGRLGLDHDRVLMGRYAIPVVSRLLHLSGGSFRDAAHRDAVLYWYVESALWGRFAGSAETFLQQDYEAVARRGVDGLIANLERWRGGNLRIAEHDLAGSTRGSRFYPLLYLLSRVTGTRDLGNGLPLRAEFLGPSSAVQVQHVFPKDLLRGQYDRSQVNAIANFCFGTQHTDLQLGSLAPEEYLPAMESAHPGVLASQWIPDDPGLWTVNRYPDFLAARRSLLAEAAQKFLDQLRCGAWAPSADLVPLVVAADDGDDAVVLQVRTLVEQLTRQGYARPRLDAEISDPVSGREIAVAEAFWPDGLQPGQGSPTALVLGRGQANRARLEELGHEVFTSISALLGYATTRNQAAAGGAEPVPVPAAAPAPAVASSAARPAASSAARPAARPAASPAAHPAPSGSRSSSARPVSIAAQYGLLKRFAKDMKSIYAKAKETGCTSTQYHKMLATLGPTETARSLLSMPAASDGFAALWERGRLDLSVEALVLRPEYAELFDESELEVARVRLKQFGYRPD